MQSLGPEPSGSGRIWRLASTALLEKKERDSFVDPAYLGSFTVEEAVEALSVD